MSPQRVPQPEQPQASPAAPRRRKRSLKRTWKHYAVDALVLSVAFAAAYLLRFDFALSKELGSDILKQFGYVVLFQIWMLHRCGAYNLIWRYVGMSEVRVFVKAALLSLIPILILRLSLPPALNDLRVPISVIFMDAVLGFGGALGARVWGRFRDERKHRKPKQPKGTTTAPKKPVLLIGAGRAGMLVAKEIQGRGDTDLEICGFVDDAPEKLHSMVHGVLVIGKTWELPQLVHDTKAELVVLTIAQTERDDDIRRIVEICDGIPVKTKIIPDLDEILQGQEVSRFRDIRVEDLLGRAPVNLDVEGVSHFLGGKCVMVSGAGGSIGAELVRQIARFEPSRLLLVERAEPALFNIDHELRDTCPPFEVVPLVADVGDEARMRRIISEHRPQVVFHAAAHKHVPMMESNAAEAVKNNVLATHTLGRLAGEFGAEVFVLISTDKAVRPTSIMGASKRIAEMVVQSLDKRFATRYVAVRFGNVLGSAGSVLPIFREQIKRGGPVTVTHEEMKRYFMTIPEAAQLVLQAGGIGNGGEIFILDMGEPVRIYDLAKDAIKVFAANPKEIDIVVTGVRPGEKLFEELALNEEQITKTRHPKIYIGKVTTYTPGKVTQGLERLRELAERGDEPAIRHFIADFLPEATLNGNGHHQHHGNGNGNGHHANVQHDNGYHGNGNGNGKTAVTETIKLKTHANTSAN